MTTTDRPVSDERAAEIADMVDHRHSGLGAYWGLIVRQFLADRAWCNAEMARYRNTAVTLDKYTDDLQRECDELSAKLGTVLLCANCGAAAVAATAEQGNP